MSKKNRNRRRAQPRQVAVTDAAQVIAMVDQLIGRAQDQPPLWRDQALTWIGDVATEMRTQWDTTRVVLRTDTEFAGALLGSSTDVELVPDWMTRMPFSAVAYSFADPISVHDGHQRCDYHGFLACGVRTRPDPRPNVRGAWTTYHPLADGEGIRLLWLFTTRDDPTPQAQTVTAMVTGPLGKARTLQGLIEALEHNAATEGHPWGQEYQALVPLGLQLLLYLAAQDPDLDELPPDSYTRPQQLDRAVVANLGWRVGSALRAWRAQPPAATPPGDPGGPDNPDDVPSDPSPRLQGWRLPPHIRRAHWHRVRVATRDETGSVTGDRSGQHGVDWHYQLRWYPPTPVNTHPDGPAPTVRRVDDTVHEH